MAGGGMVKSLNDNQMTTTPEAKTTETTQPPMSGGKGAGRVSPTVESRPMFQNQDSMFGRLLNRETPPTPVTPPPSTGGGGKGAGRVSPIVESRPVFQDLRDNPGLDNPVFRGLVQRQNKERFQPVLDNAFQQAGFPSPAYRNEQPQQSITGMNMNTGSTNSLPAPQSSIFKKGGLIGLMRKK
mgnify:CR=1 FL=1|tara:strand:- start:153 stop:701 length:549 start_codon:yes stop_codon:yes gene_type:complete